MAQPGYLYEQKRLAALVRDFLGSEFGYFFTRVLSVEGQPPETMFPILKYETNPSYIITKPTCYQ